MKKKLISIVLLISILVPMLEPIGLAVTENETQEKLSKGNSEYEVNAANDEAEPITHKVIFKNYDGTKITERLVEHGKSEEIYPVISVSRPAEGSTNYAFIGWDVDCSNVTTDLVATAQYGEIHEKKSWRYVITPENTAIIVGYIGTDKSIKVPEKVDNYLVTEIGPGAFYYSSIWNISFPASLEKIGASAFYASKLNNEITIPEKVTTLGYCTFAYCKDLRKVTLQADSVTLGYWVFDGCEKLAQVVGEVKFSGNSEDTFYGCKLLPTITINNETTIIPESAFKNCTGLTEIRIPDAVISIEDNAFCSCNNLTSVEVPDNVTTIGEYAFSGCSKLNGIKLPENLVTIGVSAFSCSGLTQIEIPNKVTRIEGRTFYECSKLTNIKLPKDLEVIEHMAFTLCKELTAIELPDTVTKIGFSAFEDCTKLANVKLSKNLINIESDVFERCSNLTQIEIPNKITKIESSTFSGCSSLTNVKLPENLISIEASAFKSCSNLDNIKLPESLEKIGYEAFAECKCLTQIEIPNKITEIDGSTFLRCSSLTNVKLPDNLENIDNYAFSGCNSLVRIDIPESTQAIYYGSLPKEITIAGIAKSYAETYAKNGNFNFIRKYRVTFKDEKGDVIKQEEVDEKKAATAPELPKQKGYKVVWDKDFTNIVSHLEVTASYVKKEEYIVTFKDYDGTVLKEEMVYEDEEATAPEEPTREDYGFIGWDKDFTKVNSNLEITAQYEELIFTVIFRNYNGTILKRENVKNRRSATPPSERPTKPTDYIGAYEFAYWDKDYTNVTSDLVVTALYKRLVTQSPWLYFIEPKNTVSVTMYLGSEPSLNIPNRMSGYTVTALDTYAFTGKTTLTNVKMPDTITKIGDGAFSATNIEKIVLPPNLEEMGEGVFDVCFKLETVVLPNSLKALKNSSFSGCKVLKNINLQDTEVVDIGNKAFQGCRALEKIILPNTTKTIGDFAFKECASLTNIYIPNTVTSISSNAFEDVNKSILTIYGNEDSYAQTYANENEINFQAIEMPTSKIQKDGVEYYEISNSKQLAYIAQAGDEWLNKNYILVNDIILNNVAIEYNLETGDLITDVSLLKKWQPIGSKNEVFTGIFDGNNHKISGLYIDETEGKDAMEDAYIGIGLFGKVEGSVKNVNVENSYIKGLWNVGGIVGFANPDEWKTLYISQDFTNPQEHSTCTPVKNCTFNGAIVGAGNLGGIIGFGCGHVENCTNYGNIYGSLSTEWVAFELNGDTIGGLVGNAAAVIKNSKNEGNIVAKGSSIGGLVGNASGLEITNSYNTGNVTGNEQVGGIAGSGLIDISYTYNKGNISGNSKVGGIVGRNIKALINSYNIGNVVGNSDVGGVCGVKETWYEGNKIEGCYYLKDTTIQINENITGIGNEVEQKGVAEAKLKEFFPICLDSNADASYGKLGYEIEPNPDPDPNPDPEPTVTLGDINNDGRINPSDARLALLYYVGKENLTQSQLKAADVNKDGKVNPTDARQILLYYVGKIEEF